MYLSVNGKSVLLTLLQRYSIKPNPGAKTFHPLRNFGSLSPNAVTGRKPDAPQRTGAYISSQHHPETHMITRTLPKFLALTLAAIVSASWLSTVVTAMHSQPAPALYSIELPTVVIVAQKASAPQASAHAPALPAKNV